MFKALFSAEEGEPPEWWRAARPALLE